ncbi:hypothetical protein G7Y89_g12663 [Cudoniella acicularis]|uniref:Uncharacterized protein n=1 Tax=Cudoniella acicularis TaxID=354080 RepID=A0A8H4VZF7_9HELO|nr:hypothetical protein G7Y89_g12663 [Cudoniella acicularis]
MKRDVHAIFANLLDFHAEEVLLLPENQRMKAILCAQERLPLRILYNRNCSQFKNRQDHLHNWVPEFPKGKLISSTDWMDGTTDGFLIKPEDATGRAIVIPSWSSIPQERYLLNIESWGNFAVHNHIIASLKTPTSCSYVKLLHLDKEGKISLQADLKVVGASFVLLKAQEGKYDVIYEIAVTVEALDQVAQNQEYKDRFESQHKNSASTASASNNKQCPEFPFSSAEIYSLDLPPTISVFRTLGNVTTISTDPNQIRLDIMSKPSEAEAETARLEALLAKLEEEFLRETPIPTAGPSNPYASKYPNKPISSTVSSPTASLPNMPAPNLFASMYHGIPSNYVGKYPTGIPNPRVAPTFPVPATTYRPPPTSAPLAKPVQPLYPAPKLICGGKDFAYKRSSGRKWYGRVKQNNFDPSDCTIIVCNFCYANHVEGKRYAEHYSANMTEFAYAPHNFDGWKCQTYTQRSRQQLQLAATFGTFKSFAEWWNKREELRKKKEAWEPKIAELREKLKVANEELRKRRAAKGSAELKARQAELSAVVAGVGARDKGKRYGNSAIGHDWKSLDMARAQEMLLDVRNMDVSTDTVDKLNAEMRKMVMAASADERAFAAAE